MKKILILAFLCAVPSWAVTTGFTTGNELTATVLRGHLSVQCQEGYQNDFGHFSCSKAVLDPAEYTYFITDVGGDADTVTLTAQWVDGKTVTKSEGFDPSSGRSTDSFNLWIQTVFQEPLLNMGENKIHFVLSKAGATVREGDFIANIQQGADRFCSDGFESSMQMDDCRFGYNACDNYFAHQNFCQ